MRMTYRGTYNGMRSYREMSEVLSRNISNKDFIIKQQGEKINAQEATIKSQRTHIHRLSKAFASLISHTLSRTSAFASVSAPVPASVPASTPAAPSTAAIPHSQVGDAQLLTPVLEPSIAPSSATTTHTTYPTTYQTTAADNGLSASSMGP